MSNLLLQACAECVADAGKENDVLVQRLHDYIHERYESKGEPWSYDMIDELIQKWTTPVECRDLDGVYFRVERDGKWKPLCFSDLTEQEMFEQIKDRDKHWLIGLCLILGKRLREIGDELDLVCGEPEEEK